MKETLIRCDNCGQRIRENNSMTMLLQRVAGDAFAVYITISAPYGKAIDLCPDCFFDLAKEALARAKEKV